MDYNQEDFTEDNYTNLLNLAKENYSFKNFTEFDNAEKFILWRHDIDFSVHRALRLAEIENKADIKATYFLQLNCEFYNIFETIIKDKTKKILSLGHSLGLHFDPTAYNITNKRGLEKHLRFEKEILEQLFDTEIKVFSFHNPTPELLKFDDNKLAEMVNTYAQVFKEDFGYCSDSNGYWRHDRLEDVLRKAQFNKLQVLTHPAWWQKEVMLPRNRIRKCIDGRAKAIETSYDTLLEKHDRKNIG